MPTIDIKNLYSDCRSSESESEILQLMNTAGIENILESILENMINKTNETDYTNLMRVIYRAWCDRLPQAEMQVFFDNKEQLISLLSKDQQGHLARKYPSKYLKYLNEDVQDELCSNYKDLIQYRGSIFQETYYTKFPFLLVDASQSIQTKLCQKDPKKFLKYANKTLQRTLCRDVPEKYLKHFENDDDFQYSFYKEEDPKKFLKHASERVQKNLCQKEPEKYLKHASDRVQETLCQENPEKYLKHFMYHVDFQYKFCKKNSIKSLRYATPSTQERLCKETPEEHFNNASVSVQIDLCRGSPELFLHRASDKVQTKLCINYPESLFKLTRPHVQTLLCEYQPELLKFASDDVQNNMCMNDPSMRLFTKESQDNILTAMSAAIKQCQKSWLFNDKQKKINLLTAFRNDYLADPSLGNLQKFMNEASKARTSAIGQAKDGETKTYKAFIAALHEPLKHGVLAIKSNNTTVDYKNRYKAQRSEGGDGASLGIEQEPGTTPRNN